MQELTNRFLDGRRAILQNYSSPAGADAITGADAAIGRLTAPRDEVFGQSANGYHRQGRIIREFPEQFLEGTLRQLYDGPGSTARTKALKLLTDGRFTRE